MSITSVGCRECAALPAIGRNATEKAIITANMVRLMPMAKFECPNIRRNTTGSSDNFFEPAGTTTAISFCFVPGLLPTCPQARLRPALTVMGARFSGWPGNLFPTRDFIIRFSAFPRVD